VRKVRPGEVLVFSRAGVTRHRIVPRSWTRPPDLASGHGESVRLVRREVEAAVRRQLLSDVPVGLFLSGGVDSSIIAAVAAAHNPDLRTFSIRPADAFADPGAQADAEIAARFARSLGLSHRELLVRPDDVWDELDSLATSVDEPVSELYFAAEVLLSWAARGAGVPVVLTGHGADEVFLGYPTYQAVSTGDRYNTVPLFGPAARALARWPMIAPQTRENLRGAASVWRRSPADRYAIVSAVHFSLPEAAALADLPPAAVGGAVRQVLDEAKAASAVLPRSRPLTTAEWFARMDLLLKVPENYNMRLDRATMVASVEARVPFQDLDLIGSVMHLPARDLLRGGLKGLLKQAFRDVLPQEVLNRPKQTFQAPMLSWVRGPLAPWLSTQLAHLPAPLRAALPTKDAPPRSTREAYRLWCLGLLEAWRTALDLDY
jgi:asparagine synthase (glutamine-hydrolysing)